MLELAGVFPVSAINLGLNVALPGLAAEAADIQADLSQIGTNVVAQGQVALNVPDVVSLGAAAAARLNPVELAASYSGAPTAGAALNAELALDLAAVTGQIEVVSPITATLTAGLNSDGISGWSFAGRADRYGPELARQTRTGFGRIAATDTIRAVIIATESFASWGAFSEGMYTGGTANQEASAGSASLNFLGTLGAADWNTGTASVLARIEFFLEQLEGEKAAIESQIQASIGVGVGAPDVVVDAGLDVVGEIGAEGLLENLLTAKADFTADASGVQAKLDLLLDLTGSIEAQLSAGGLALWVYEGPANLLGDELAAALADGVPNGSGPGAVVYGLVLAGRPESMDAFGGIFRTAA